MNSLDVNGPRQRAIEKVRALRARIEALDDNALDLIFREARTHYTWLDKDVPDAIIHELYEIVKAAPTSRNGNPVRYTFVKSNEAKGRLLECVNEGNKIKVQTAPVTVIVAYDLEFWMNLARLNPHKDMSGKLEIDPGKAKTDAFRNSTLQGAYLMLAARALGLDVGPLSGFSNEAVDEQFFKNGSFRSNFLCNVGYGNADGIFPRLPRLDFDEVCEII